nr:unnamed protein product [Callosobruchus chinensis]
MLKHSAAAILENLSSSDLRAYSKITSALKLRFGNADSTELMYDECHNRTQQAKEDSTTFAYERSLTVSSRHRNTSLLANLSKVFRIWTYSKLCDYPAPELYKML